MEILQHVFLKELEVLSPFSDDFPLKKKSELCHLYLMIVSLSLLCSENQLELRATCWIMAGSNKLW